MLQLKYSIYDFILFMGIYVSSIQKKELLWV